MNLGIIYIILDQKIIIQTHPLTMTYNKTQNISKSLKYKSSKPIRSQDTLRDQIYLLCKKNSETVNKTNTSAPMSIINKTNKVLTTMKVNKMYMNIDKIIQTMNIMTHTNKTNRS